MKKLFIYYSLTGNGDLVASKLKEKCDLRKVNVKKELPKSLFLKMMIGGFKAIIGYKEKLVDFDSNIDNYDEIIIGSPIWNDRLCSPIRTILNTLDLSSKKLLFILYSGGGIANTAYSFVKNNYKDANVIILQEPKKYNNELDKIK